MVATPESHFKSELGLLASGEDVQEDLGSQWSRIRIHWRFRIWDFDPGLPPRPMQAPELLLWLVERYAASVGQPSATVWVDHTPENLLNWDALFDAFPNALGIHLVRDGRAVAASVRPLRWGPKTMMGCANWWKKRAQAGLQAEQQYDDRLIRVRFEDLVDSPEKSLERLTDFLGVPYQPEMKPGDGFEKPAYTLAQHRLVGSLPQKSRSQAWKQTLGSRDIEIFEAECGPLLESLGYPLCTESPRPLCGFARAGSHTLEKIYQWILLPLHRIPTRGPYVLSGLQQRLRDWLP